MLQEIRHSYISTAYVLGTLLTANHLKMAVAVVISITVGPVRQVNTQILATAVHADISLAIANLVVTLVLAPIVPLVPIASVKI